MLLFLIPIVSFGQAVLQKTIYFASNSATLDQKSLRSIDSLASLCSNQTNYSITLWGHTDAIGSLEFNKGLSERRASAVMDYFLTKNIPASKFKHESFGETKPFTSNASENTRAQNRRVEITLEIQKVEPTAVVPQNNNEGQDTLEQDKDTLAWPGDNAIVVKPGKSAYRVPGTEKGRVNIGLITTTAEMEAENITTVTTDGFSLTSNIMFSIAPVIGCDCKLPRPIKIYIPAGIDRFCNFSNVRFYDAEKDTIGIRSVKWREIPPSFTLESRNDSVYFVMTIDNLCNLGLKNFDCPEPRTTTAAIRLRARKYKLKQVDAIHETENALLPGKEVSKNKWQIVYLDSPGIEKPTIKLRYANKTKNFLKRFRWDELKRDRKGYLLVTKKQLKAD